MCLRTCLILSILFLATSALKSQEDKKADAPAFSKTDARKSLFWMMHVAKDLANPTGNDFADRQRKADAEKELAKAKGKKIAWSLPVESVTGNGIALTLIHQTVIRRYKLSVRPLLPPGAINANRFPVEDEKWAATLHPGDLVKVTGTIESVATPSGEAFFVILRDPKLGPKD